MASLRGPPAHALIQSPTDSILQSHSALSSRAEQDDSLANGSAQSRDPLSADAIPAPNWHSQNGRRNANRLAWPFASSAKAGNVRAIASPIPPPFRYHFHHQ